MGLRARQKNPASGEAVHLTQKTNEHDRFPFAEGVISEKQQQK